MRLARALERFLLPNACVCCVRSVPRATPDVLTCSVCRARLRPLGRGCGRCGQPVPPIGPCRFCADWPPELTRVRSAVWLTDEARDLVHHLKYEGLPRLADELADVMVKSLRRAPTGCLVPIPLVSRRERSRGYNQAERLAVALGKRWRMRVESGALHRRRDTKSQTALAPDARWANVADAFHAPTVRGEPLAILIDDVMTTGATLVAAASALVQAGWTCVNAATFARAEPFVIRAGRDRSQD